MVKVSTKTVLKLFFHLIFYTGFAGIAIYDYDYKNNVKTELKYASFFGSIITLYLINTC